jgi:hypothetical protein
MVGGRINGSPQDERGEWGDVGGREGKKQGFPVKGGEKDGGAHEGRDLHKIVEKHNIFCNLMIWRTKKGRRGKQNT